MKPRLIENKNTVYNCKILSNYLKIPVIKFIDSETKQTLLQKTLNPGTQYRLSVMETSSDREDFIPIIQKEDNFYYGPKQFLIEDGEYDPKGINKWIFDRVINEDTTIEVEMMKFDYYFETNPTETEIDNILTTHNNDLSQINFGFSDNVNKISNLFRYDRITESPKHFYGRYVNIISSLFENAKLVKTNVSNTLFDFCHNIIQISTLDNMSTLPEDVFWNNTKIENLSYLFSLNPSLTSIPENLFKNCPKLKNVKSMFVGTSITSVSKNLFKNSPLIENVDSLFNRSDISNVPTELFKNNPNIINFNSIFRDCASLKHIPNDIFSYSLKATEFEYIFEGSGLNEIPKDLFINNTEVNSFTGAFRLCKELITVPFNLFDNCKKIVYADDIFEFSENITSNVPDLWNKEKFPNIRRYSNCYFGCTKAANYNDIPEDWKN